jgi:hypothetical protein
VRTPTPSRWVPSSAGKHAARAGQPLPGFYLEVAMPLDALLILLPCSSVLLALPLVLMRCL